MKTYSSLLFVCLVFGVTNCQVTNDFDFDKNAVLSDIEKGLGNIGVSDIEKRLQENGIGSLNDTSVLQDKYEKVLKEKCEKNGAPEAVELLKGQNETLKNCVSQYIDFTVVKQELEKAQETGSMDEVFGKYCRKWPDIYNCVENVTDVARKCMDDKEKVAFNRSLEILAELQEFLCFKDGDRLAMFVAEGGIECVQDRSEGLQECVNSTVGSRIPTEELSVANLPTFLFTDRDCDDFMKIKTCVNIELEKCKDSTPANIIDAFFKFLKKHMPCSADNPVEVELKQLKTSGSSTFTASYVIVLICVVVRSSYSYVL